MYSSLAGIISALAKEGTFDQRFLDNACVSLTDLRPARVVEGMRQITDLMVRGWPSEVPLPPQRVEFLARTLHKNHGESHDYTLGSPIYVALAD
jgi:hypothetical protein